MNKNTKVIKNILGILKEKPNKSFSSGRLSRLLNLDMKIVTNSMSFLIKKNMVNHKFIYNPNKNMCLRLIRWKENDSKTFHK
jgi:hypothetical protein